MATLETIRRIRLEASQRGFPEVEAALERFEEHTEAVGVALDSTDKKTQSAARAFDAMTKRLDPVHREMSQLTREFTTLARATEQGMGLAEQARLTEAMFAKLTSVRERAAAAEKKEADAIKENERIKKESAAADAKRAADRIAEAEKVTAALRKQQDAQRAEADIGVLKKMQTDRAAVPGAVAGAMAEQVKAQNEMARNVAQLRGEFLPTVHAGKLYEEQMKRITAAETAGAIKGKEATDLRAAALARLEKVNRDHGGKLGMTLSQNTQLAYQMNDVISGLAMGQSPLTVLTQQGGQIYQAFADHPGGAAAGLKAFATRAKEWFTVSRSVGLGLGALGVAAAVSAVRFQSLRTEVERMTTGLGRGVGLDPKQFDQWAQGMAQATGLSTRQVTEMGVAFGRTGRIGLEAMGALTSIAKDFGATMGMSTEEAAKELEKLFVDPVAGMEQLQKQFLGFVDQGMERYIRSLVAAGDQQKAIVALTDQLKARLANATATQGEFNSAWEKLVRLISEADMGLGRLIDKAASAAGKTTEAIQQSRMSFSPGAQGVRSQDNVQTQNARFSEPQGPPMPMFVPEGQLAQNTQHYNAMATAMGKAAEEQRLLADGKLTVELAQRVEAIKAETRQLGENSAERMRHTKMLELFRDAQKSLNPLYRAQVAGIENVDQAMAMLERRNRIHLTDQERLNEEQRVATMQRTARTDAEKQAATEAATRLRLNKEEMTTAKESQIVDHERNLIAEERRVTTQSMIDAQHRSQAEIQKEIDLLGLSSGEREIAIARLQAENELKAQGADVSTALSQKYIAEAEATARLNQARQAAKLQGDLTFERDQMGRSEMEQGVASRLRSAGLPLDHAIGAQIRLNEQLKIGHQLAMDFGKGFAQDLRNGVEASEALVNALNRVADKLMDMAMDMAISQLFKGLTAGFGGGLPTMGMGGMGPDIPVGVGHTGGILGRDALPKRYVHPAHFDDAPRFHRGGMVAPNEVPIIAKKGEGVFTPGQMAAMGGSKVVINPVIENNSKASAKTEVSQGPNGDIQIKTMIQDAAAEGVGKPGNPMNRAVRTFGGGMPLTRR